jgi:hypothetical protein
MKVVVKSNRIKTVVYRTKTLSVDKFTVVELYTDDVLIEQKWSVKGGFKQTHPLAYEPKYMRFAFYHDVSFLNSDKCSNFMEFESLIPQPTMVLDWDKFDNLDQILCIYLGMDGNIYRINDPQPIPMWRYFDYIFSFTNEDYDLDKVVKILEKKKWIRNIKVIEIPYYNKEDDKTHAVEFEYKLPSKSMLGEKLRKNKLFENHYFL